MSDKTKILVTGGTGYIGSHTTITLMNSGYEVGIVDNFSNSQPSMLERIEEVIGNRPIFEEVDLRNPAKVEELFKKHPDIKGIIHFAANKAVGESVEKPVQYYHNNLNCLLNLLSFKPENVESFIFSSSCTVYGEPENPPVNENAPIVKPNAPYGNTKKICEEILEDHVAASTSKAIALRYFNPIGAHPSGLIGEMPTGVPDNLVPYITQTAIGKREKFTVFGDDYPTHDGSCIRDYIHIMDLAEAHLQALERNLKGREKANFEVFNLGTGTGYSVFEVLKTFMKVNEVDVPYQVGERRAGDVSAIWADPTFANEELGWKARFGLEDMLESAWRWEKHLHKTIKSEA